jgi:hypothetical protein
MRRRTAFIGAIVAFSMTPALSCSNGPSSGEAAVCDSLQAIVDDLTRSDRAAALDRFYTLSELTDQSENDAMRTSGEEFFAIISENVDGYQDMTVAETTAFADQALARASAPLERIVDECARVGRSIELADPASLAPDR